MANYNRQGTAPIEEGDSLDPSEIEAEFTSIQTIINGNLDNSNLSGSAAITGSNIAPTTITGSNIAANTVTKGKLALAATGQVVISDADGSASPALTNVNTWQNCISTSDITVPSLVSGEDWVILDYSGQYVNSDASSVTLHFGFGIDGADPTEQLVEHLVDTTVRRPVSVHWAFQATASSHIFRPMVKMAVARTPVQQTTGSRVIFTAFSIPAK